MTNNNRLNPYTAVPPHPCTLFQQEEVIVMSVTLGNTKLDWNFWHIWHKVLKSGKTAHSLDEI